MKKILSFIGILTSIVSAGDIIVTGNIQPASIVGFDSTTVNGGTYITNTNKFFDATIDMPMTVGQKLLFTKDIYVKSNSTGGLKMAMSASAGGRLENATFDTIAVAYYLNNNKVNMNGSDYKELYASNTTPNEVVTLANAFKVEQTGAVNLYPVAGTYTTTITVSLSAI